MSNIRKNKRIKRFFFLTIFCLAVMILIFQAAPKDLEKEFSINLFNYWQNNLEQNKLIEAKDNSYESLPMVLVEQDSIVGISAPVMISPQILGASTGYGPTDSLENEIKEYTVQSGDTLSSLATRFNISTDTIRWANEIGGDGLQVGEKLIILPVDGILHVIEKDETLGGIAQRHKGSTQKIVEFNDLTNAHDIYIGDILIIPGGEQPTTPPRGRNLASVGSFICPTNNCRITQGLHYFNAIDFGEPCGSPIYAAATGTVQRVSYGWNSGGGNLLTILHDNGIVTYYGHLQSSLVSPGQRVSQGQQIAIVGGQPGTSGAGISTGCHLHFDFRGGRNPFAR